MPFEKPDFKIKIPSETPGLNTAYAISSTDGRYWEDVWPVSLYFSEYAINRNRIMIEVEYLIDFHDFINEPLDNVYV